MANCPVQVILDSDRFITDAVVNPGGRNKDFYSGRNADFEPHKNSIIDMFSGIGELQMANAYSSIGFAKVRLIKEGWSKSYRPTKAIFTERNGCKVVGGLHTGELLIKMGPESSGKIIRGITQNAELIPRKVINAKGIEEEKPSNWRCEVGAICDVSLYSESDRVSFSSDEMVAWIEQNHSGMLYVELFGMPPHKAEWDTLDSEHIRLFDSFIKGLESFKGIRVNKSVIDAVPSLLTVLLTEADDSVVSLYDNYSTPSDGQNITISQSQEGYKALLSFLSSHPLVKKVTITPVVECLPSRSFAIDETQYVSIPNPSPDSRYPTIAVVDSGISNIYDAWKCGGWDMIPNPMRDNTHGTFVSGLLINGQLLNSPEVCKDPDGCKVVDVCLLPKPSEFSVVYPNLLESFYAELKAAVADITSRTGVRVFNLSMNVAQTRLCSEYSPFAKALDSLATTYNIVFVISAGNLRTPRAEMTDDVDCNISTILSRADDIAYAPAESVRNLSVGALNPSNLLLTSYSCKGKGSVLGLKPDLVQVGGLGYLDPAVGHGLYSLNPDGKIKSWCGTSFSAPLVSKMLAVLENSIEGTISRETLMALAIQSASIPQSFADKRYVPYLKDIVGYGIPSSAASILEGNEHSITLVFANRLAFRKELAFTFNWPQALITNGRCRGHIKLTLVSTPRLNYNYNDEMVRENLHVTLSQIDPAGRNVQRLKPMYAPESQSNNEIGEFEWELVEGNMKWQPTKVYESSFKALTNLSPWTLKVTRDDKDPALFSDPGVPFTIILTISDPQGDAYIYHEMRNSLRSIGVQLSDIQTAARITQRV